MAKMIDVVVLMEILNKQGHWDGESTTMQVKDHQCKPISNLGAKVVMIHDKTKSEDDIFLCTMCIKASNQATRTSKHLTGDVTTGDLHEKAFENHECKIYRRPFIPCGRQR